MISPPCAQGFFVSRTRLAPSTVLSAILVAKVRKIIETQTFLHKKLHMSLNRGLMNRHNFQASHKNLQASRKNFQASRKNLQASHKKFFVSYCHLSYFQVNLLNNIDLFTNHTVIYCHILSCRPRFATGKVRLCYGQSESLLRANYRFGGSKPSAWSLQTPEKP